MDFLLSPLPLFFLLGFFATILKTNLSFPQPIPKLLSLYLLFAIGFQGGNKLALDPPEQEFYTLALLGITLSFIIPFFVFKLFDKTLGSPTASAIAASYGSVSAVTFMAGASFLQTKGISYSGSMVALLALMESPAILVGLYLSSHSYCKNGGLTVFCHVKQAFLNSSVYCLLGSMFIGYFTKEQGHAMLAPFYIDPFKGVLTLFLVDMGVVSANRIKNLYRSGWMPPLFALIAPSILAFVAIFLAKFSGVSQADTLLFSLLVGSASYLAVPAVMSTSNPQADPGIYVPLALGITFPFNITVGIPLYFSIIKKVIQ